MKFKTLLRFWESDQPLKSVLAAKATIKSLMTPHRLMLAVCCAALIEPFLYNIAAHFFWHSGSVAESSVFSLDKRKYFADLLYGKSVFMAGQYSVFTLNYFVIYVIWSLLDFILPDIASYFVMLAAFYLAAFYYCVKLFIALGDGEIDSSRVAAAGALSLLFLSSLSMFNYLKSNMLFALPYLILPLLLYFSLRFARTGDRKHLIPFFLASLLLTDFNLAHSLIIAGSVNVFLVLQARSCARSVGEFLGRVLAINLVLAPAFCFLLVIVLDNALYMGSLATFAKFVVENMYSDNAKYLNIFLQLTDWGIFGSWNGERYYDFSQFYANTRVWALGLLPFVLLGYAALLPRRYSRHRSLALSLLLVFAIIFEIMLGNNDPVYRYLYTHLVFFQVFRNITKLAPLLYLVVAAAIYLFLGNALHEAKHRFVVGALIAAALTYNVPFWTYQDYMFRDRSVQSVPQYWREAANYINGKVDPRSRILALPAIYVNDIYNWDGKANWVQGSLLDLLVRNKSFRLSECCIGPPDYQLDARNVFVPSDRSVRKKDVDYRRLGDLARKYHFDYVVLSTDLRSEYENIDDIRSWLSRDGYRRVALFGQVEIYRNSKNFQYPFEGRSTSFQPVDNLGYRIFVRHLRGKRTIAFGEPYRTAWQLHIVPFRNGAGCFAVRGVNGGNGVTICRDARDTLGLDDVRDARGAPVFEKSHVRTQDDWNAWVVDAAAVKRSFPKKAYQQNSDGSIDLELALTFAPQIRSILGLWIAGGCTVICFIVLVSTAGTLRKRVRLGVLAAAASAVVFLAAVLPLRAPAGEPSQAGSLPLRVVFAHPHSKEKIVSLPREAQDLDDSMCHGVADASLIQVSRGNASQIRVIPQAPGACTIQVYGRSRSVVASLEVHVMTAASWSQYGSETSESLVFASPLAPVESAAIYKQYDDELINLSFQGACAKVAELDHGQQSSPTEPTDVAALAAVDARPLRPGVCHVRVRDQYSGAEEPALDLNVRVMGALSFAPQAKLTYTRLKFRRVNAAPKYITVYKAYEADPIQPMLVSNPCASIAGFYPETPEAPGKVTPRPSSTRIRVVPVAAGQCTAILGDQYGPDDATVHVTVEVSK